MTLYWWTHWFWITLFGVVLIESAPLSSVDSFSSKLSNKNDDNGNKSTYLKKAGEKFISSSSTTTSGSVIANDEDVDELFGGGGIDADFDASGFSNMAKKETTTDVILTNFTRLNKNDTVFVRNSQNITTLKLKNFQSKEKELKDLKTTKIPDKGVKLIEKVQEDGENQTISVPDTSDVYPDSSENVTDVSAPVMVVTEDIIENVTSTTTTPETSSLSNSNLGRTGKTLSSDFRDINFINNPNASSYASHSAIAFSTQNLQEGIDDNDHPLEDDDYRRSSRSRLNVGAISGICLASLGVLTGISATLIILYRRYIYLNKPQTLSEPDSSGYIDDSTIRDNSDEMYSLDNDSFLNSLEAMTIQNYWTDNVKHTKL